MPLTDSGCIDTITVTDYDCIYDDPPMADSGCKNTTTMMTNYDCIVDMTMTDSGCIADNDDT